MLFKLVMLGIFFGVTDSARVRVSRTLLAMINKQLIISFTRQTKKICYAVYKQTSTCGCAETNGRKRPIVISSEWRIDDLLEDLIETSNL